MMTAGTTQETLKRQGKLARSSRRAFSLIEVIVAVTIVALLAALVVPRFAALLRGSKRKTAQIECQALHRQVDLYVVERAGGSLTDDFTLEDLTLGDDPFLNNKEDLIDPWGNQYVIIVPGEHNHDFDIMSYGLNGVAGGEGEEADIIGGKKEE